jgi:hypothetical protein
MFREFGLWLHHAGKPLVALIVLLATGLVAFLQWRTMSKLRRRAAELEAEDEGDGKR